MTRLVGGGGAGGSEKYRQSFDVGGELVDAGNYPCSVISGGPSGDGSGRDRAAPGTGGGPSEPGPVAPRRLVGRPCGACGLV